MPPEASRAPTPAEIDELVAFLPRLYAPGFKPMKEFSDDDISAFSPYPEYEDVVHDFMRVASEDWWCDFNYSPASSGDPLDDPAQVARASLDELKSMLTWCIRGERFGGGHVGVMIEEGKIRLILDRLVELRRSMPESAAGSPGPGGQAAGNLEPSL